MKGRKARLTVTVDSALVRAGTDAVKSGRAPSLSGWVNLALQARAAEERRLQAMDDAVAMYESKFGAITDQEMDAQRKRDRQNAVVYRGGRRSVRSRTRRKVA